VKTDSLSFQKVAPALTLLILSAVIVEILFGTIYLIIITALIPEIGFYGGAALLIRYAVRRLHRGWFSILLLGLAFAVFEEFLIVQTSISSTLFVGMPDATSTAINSSGTKMTQNKPKSIKNRGVLKSMLKWTGGDLNPVGSGDISRNFPFFLGAIEWVQLNLAMAAHCWTGLFQSGRIYQFGQDH